MLCQLLRGHLSPAWDKITESNWCLLAIYRVQTRCPAHPLHLFTSSSQRARGGLMGVETGACLTSEWTAKYCTWLFRAGKKNCFRQRLLKFTYLISRGLSQVSIYSLFIFYFIHTYNSLITCFINPLSGQNSANGEKASFRVQMRLKGEHDKTYI